MFVFENMGRAAVPVSLELLNYSLARSQTIPYGTCDLEAGSIKGLASAVNHSSAWLLGALAVMLTSGPSPLSSVAHPPELFVSSFESQLFLSPRALT